MPAESVEDPIMIGETIDATDCPRELTTDCALGGVLMANALDNAAIKLLLGRTTGGTTWLFDEGVDPGVTPATPAPVFDTGSAVCEAPFKGGVTLGMVIV